METSVSFKSLCCETSGPDTPQHMVIFGQKKKKVLENFRSALFFSVE